MIMEPIKHINIKEDMKVKELVEDMKDMGFGARNLGEASDILNKMINEPECRVFLGLAGAMVPGGMRQIIVDMLKNKFPSFVTYTGNTIYFGRHPYLEKFFNISTDEL